MIITFEKRNCQLFLGLVIILLLVSTCVFTVNEKEKAVVLRFGKPVTPIGEAGIYFKLPWPFNSVAYLEKRWFLYDSDPTEVITRDKKTLVIDEFALCRIDEPIRFLEQIGTMSSAQARIDDIVYSKMRQELGKKNYDQIVVKEREVILGEVTDQSNEGLAEYSLTTSMVRLNQVDLPSANQKSVFDRMSSERQRIAQSYRSEGEQEAMRIKAETKKDEDVILGAAERQAEEIRGQADAKVTQIYNETFGADPEFFRLYWSLQTVDKMPEEKRLILSGDEMFLKSIF